MDGIPKFVPRDKSDMTSVDVLKNSDWLIIKPYVINLLEWLQDMNWPVAQGVAEVLAYHTNSIRTEIKAILLGSDSIWKYWCIKHLIYYSQEPNIHPELIEVLGNLASSANSEDQAEDVDELALETIEKWNSKNNTN